MSKLYGRTYAITFKGEAIYLLSRMLHATYALASGAVVGVNWSSAKSLDIAS